MSTELRHFLNLDDIPAETLKRIISHAHELKKQKFNPPQIFAGMSLAMIFGKSSTRTRISFEVAMKQHGGHTVVMKKDEMQLGRGEPISDTAKVLSRMVDAIMIRWSKHEEVLELAKHASIPVINALTDDSHPCQIMADIMTIEEKLGTVAGKKIAWLGDYNNVAKTFVQAAGKFGFDLAFAVPANQHTHVPKQFPTTADAAQTMNDADVVVTDTWVSMGEEGKSIAAFEPFRVDAALMNKAKPSAIFMHCMPMHRGDEVTADVADGPQSVIFDEAENRLHVQKAILAWCLEHSGVKPQI